MDLNLDTLKREILDYLETAGFAVFHSSPGNLDSTSTILWDSEHYPDYRNFLDVAAKTGARLVMLASREFDSTDIEDLSSQLDECELSREDRREYDSRLRGMRGYEGLTCSLELAFDHGSRLYVYEVQPDWYEEFLELEDEISARLADEDFDENDSLGGYFSKN